MTPRELLGRSLRQLRNLWCDLVPASWSPIERAIAPDLPDEDLPHIREQMSECLLARGGEVSARARAAKLGETYLQLNQAGRLRFLELLSGDFDIDGARLGEAIEAYRLAENGARRDAERDLRTALEAPRVRLLTQFNELPNGTKFLVDLRADLLAALREIPHRAPLDADLLSILKSWFDVGFLELQRISWDSPASLLEKLITYEAVHEIESWTDLRNRLESDRRCYAFFHPHMPGEPLIFVEVALVTAMANSVQALLDESAPELDPRKATTAIFYSISNTQKGLRGISFGSFLIKRVADDLARSFPKLKTFATLSPMPGLRRWMEAALANGLPDDLTPSEAAALEARLGSSTESALLEVVSAAGWQDDAALVDLVRAPLMRLAARYLLEAKRRDRPRDPVARFHLGNGARIERLNWLGDTSANGLKQSLGMMVNYGYRLNEIEANHEAFTATGEIAISPEIRKLVRR